MASFVAGAALLALYKELEEFEDAGDKKGKDLIGGSGLPNKCAPTMRKAIKGHQRKVYCVQWSADSIHIASGGQEGYVLVTNAVTGMKVCPVVAKFVMATALNKDAKLLAVRAACAGARPSEAGSRSATGS